MLKFIPNIWNTMLVNSMCQYVSKMVLRNPSRNLVSSTVFPLLEDPILVDVCNKRLKGEEPLRSQLGILYASEKVKILLKTMWYRNSGNVPNNGVRWQSRPQCLFTLDAYIGKKRAKVKRCWGRVWSDGDDSDEYIGMKLEIFWKCSFWPKTKLLPTT